MNPTMCKKKKTLVGLTQDAPLIPFNCKDIYIVSFKRTFLLSGSQLTRLYCTSGLSLEIKESWQLCIMSSNIFRMNPYLLRHNP